jgi:L-lactate utilization protein LutB
MDKALENLIRDWQNKNILGFYYADKKETVQELLTAIPLSASVGISGSQTLDEIGIVKELEARGNKVFNQYRQGLSRQESLRLRGQGSQADYYLTSANAVSLTGELVFLSAYGERIAVISSVKNVIVVCGINKITPGLDQAIRRARDYATPLNCKRLNWGDKRMICQSLVIEAEINPGRLKVILVGEKLGF